MNPKTPEPKRVERSPGVKRITRRSLLLTGSATISLLGVRSVAAEPLDGKGNDVCPCFFDVDEVDLVGDRTLSVSGPCAVANPPEEVTVSVRVHGEGGARATGSETVVCAGSEDDEDRFSLTASIHGGNRFERGDEVTVHAKVHINPDRTPTVTGRWSWSGELS